jgi:hypothetical protein
LIGALAQRFFREEIFMASAPPARGKIALTIASDVVREIV